jgi:hypothetical protein
MAIASVAFAAPAPKPPRFTPRGFTLGDGVVTAWTVADLNRDGRADVLVGRAAGPLAYHAGPAFEPVPIAAEAAVTDAITIDVDGDRAVDAIVATPTGAIAWLRNPGQGAQPWQRYPIAAQSTGVGGVAAGELDGNERTDVVARDPQVGALHVYRQVNARVWQHTPVPGADGPGLVVDDLDGDDDGDLVFADHWLENTNDAGKIAWTPHAFGAAGGSTNARVAIADVDGDGRKDVVVATDAGVTWLAGPRDRRAACTAHAIGAFRGPCTDVAVADLDGDRKPEVIAACAGAIAIAARTDGDWVKRPLPPPPRGLTAPARVAAADVDGDGDLDLLTVVTGKGNGATLVVWQNGTK